MNQWDLAYAYNYEGFSAGYVATCLVAGFAAFAVAAWRRNSVAVATPSATDGLEGLDELLGQARSQVSAEAGQEPVAV